MTDPKEKDEPIRTRKPGKIGGGMFDRVKLPEQRHPIEEILAGGPTPPSPTAPGTLIAPGTPDAPGEQPAPGISSTPGRMIARGISPTPGKRTAPRRHPAPGRPDAGSAPVTPVSDISPRRDFTKTANSLLRDVLSRGLFRGKSRDIYDYLYSRTRGAIVPTRSALLTTTEIMRGANIGSDHTLRDNLRHLKLVGLVEWKVNAGAQAGNEYFVYLPEEANLPFDREGNPLHLNSPPQVSSPPQSDSPGQKLPGAPGAETAGGAGGLSPVDSVTSESPKTSFKTNTEKTDDEAFADLVALLRQAAEEVTGKGTTDAERGRWGEVAQLLVAELKVAATRTTISSAPAFLAEHLRRRLRKADARQIEREVAEAASGVAAQPGPAKPELTHEQIEEQAQLLAGLMQGGAGIAELEEQFAANFRPAQWHQIRSIALATRPSPDAPSTTPDA